MHGYSVNSTKPAELKMAESTILDVKPRVKMFRSDTIDALINKEVAVAQSYSTDALQAVRNSGGTIEYILPEDGGTKAIDNLVIVKGSKNIEAAHQLINFLLSLKANVSFVKSVMGGPVLRDSKSQLPEELQKNQSLFPTSQIISRYENIIDLGDATALFDALWTKIKTE
jgi:spermidine/putrescine transport system substrate-binding protein